MRDSAVLNIDAYKNFIRRLRRLQKRELEVKEYAMEEVTAEAALARLEPLLKECQTVTQEWAALHFWKRLGYRTILRHKGFDQLQNRMNETIEFISNSKNPKAIQLLNCYPYKISPIELPTVTQTTASLIELFIGIKNLQITID